MKILISDFDKTFFTSDYQKNIVYIRDFVNKGNLFVIATGRTLVDLKKDIENFSIPYSYLICNDGGVVFNTYLQVINETNISNNTAYEIFQYFQTKTIYNNIYTIGVHDKNKEFKYPVNKIIIKYNDSMNEYKVINNIKNRHSLVECYLSENWINIISKNSSKGNAITFLVEKNNWHFNNVYSVGDHINDLSMMHYNGFAMYDSEDELKKVSYGLTPSVWKLIEFLLKEKED